MPRAKKATTPVPEEVTSPFTDVFCEVFDLYRARYILGNPEWFLSEVKHLYPHLLVKKDGTPVDTSSMFGTLERYVKLHFDKNTCTNFHLGQTYSTNESVGYALVQYHTASNGKGRYFANGGLSLQSMWRPLRRTLACAFYLDIDCVNCHPVLLVYICDTHNIKCLYLKRYVNNRDKYINDLAKYLGYSRDQAKYVFLSIMNGGISAQKHLVLDANKVYKEIIAKAMPDSKDATSVKQIKTFILRFEAEIKCIHTKLAEHYKDDILHHLTELKYSGDEFRVKNYKASFCNVLLCTEENNILECIFEALGSPYNSILCFDGIMIPQTMNVDLCYLEQFITTKFPELKLKLAFKKMNEGIDIQLNSFDAVPTPSLEEQVSDYIHNQITTSLDKITDKECADLYIQFLREDIIINDDAGNGFLYNDEICIWEPITAKRLRYLLINPKYKINEGLSLLAERYVILKKSANDKLLDYYEYLYKLICHYKRCINTDKFLASVYNIASSILIVEGLKRAELLNKEYDLFSIADNMVICLKTSTLHPRLREHYFTTYSPVHFIPPLERDPKLLEQFHEFIYKIACENAEVCHTYQFTMGSFLSGGRNLLRNAYIWKGLGSNGKSCIINALEKIMGGFATRIASTTIAPVQTAPTSQNSHSAQLLDLKGRRLVIVNEVRPGCTLDEEIFKCFASNDPLPKARAPYEKAGVDIELYSKLVIAVNEMPNFTSDSAVAMRMCILPFYGIFIPEPEYVEYKAKHIKDDDVKVYIKDECVAELYREYGIHLDYFFSWLVDGCKMYYEGYAKFKAPPIVLNYRTNILEENDILSLFISEKCKIGNEYEEQSNTLWIEFDKWQKQGNIPKLLSCKQFRAEIIKKYKPHRTNTSRMYCGLKLNDDNIF